jgi:hypothetical protein
MDISFTVRTRLINHLLVYKLDFQFKQASVSTGRPEWEDDTMEQAQWRR